MGSRRTGEDVFLVERLGTETDSSHKNNNNNIYNTNGSYTCYTSVQSYYGGAYYGGGGAFKRSNVSHNRPDLRNSSYFQLFLT